MKNMMFDHLPRRYHFLWDPHKSKIVMQIHKDCVMGTTPVPQDSPWIKHMRQTHAALSEPSDSFEGNLSGDSFGFNKLIKKIGTSENYVDFEIGLPKIRQETANVCEECGGTGTRLLFPEPCFFCDQTGKKAVLEWRDAYLTTASLGVLLNIMEMCDEPKSTDHQYITMTVCSIRGEHHGSSIGGNLGIELSDYLCTDTEELRTIVLPNVTMAMKIAYKTMMLRTRHDAYSTRSEVSDNGYLTLTCPGEACGIHSSSHNLKRGVGQEFSCHNTDTPAQAMTLIAGLASLATQAEFYIQARKEQLART